jgi:hypothetical protein
MGMKYDTLRDIENTPIPRHPYKELARLLPIYATGPLPLRDAIVSTLRAVSGFGVVPPQQDIDLLREHLGGWFTGQSEILALLHELGYGP